MTDVKLRDAFTSASYDSNTKLLKFGNPSNSLLGSVNLSAGTGSAPVVNVTSNNRMTLSVTKEGNPTPTPVYLGASALTYPTATSASWSATNKASTAVIGSVTSTVVGIVSVKVKMTYTGSDDDYSDVCLEVGDIQGSVFRITRAANGCFFSSICLAKPGTQTVKLKLIYDNSNDPLAATEINLFHVDLI